MEHRDVPQNVQGIVQDGLMSLLTTNVVLSTNHHGRGRPLYQSITQEREWVCSTERYHQPLGQHVGPAILPSYRRNLTKDNMEVQLVHDHKRMDAVAVSEQESFAVKECVKFCVALIHIYIKKVTRNYQT